jgi:hypothetical protein
VCKKKTAAGRVRLVRVAWADHHIEVFAPFAALNANHHALAIRCQVTLSVTGLPLAKTDEG